MNHEPTAISHYKTKLTLRRSIGSDLGTVEASTDDLFTDHVTVHGVTVTLASVTVRHRPALLSCFNVYRGSDG